jgi:hypothetical protein
MSMKWICPFGQFDLVFHYVGQNTIEAIPMVESCDEDRGFFLRSEVGFELLKQLPHLRVERLLCSRILILRFVPSSVGYRLLGCGWKRGRSAIMCIIINIIQNKKDEPENTKSYVYC